MEQDSYKGRLAREHGIEVIVPDEKERRTVHDVCRLRKVVLAATAPRAAGRVVAALVEQGGQGPGAGSMIWLPTDERSLEPYDVRHIEIPDNPHYRATKTDHRLVGAGKTW